MPDGRGAMRSQIDFKQWPRHGQCAPQWPRHGQEGAGTIQAHCHLSIQFQFIYLSIYLCYPISLLIFPLFFLLAKFYVYAIT